MISGMAAIAKQNANRAAKKAGTGFRKSARMQNKAVGAKKTCNNFL